MDMFWEDFNLHKEDRKYILILSVLILLCFAKLMQFAMSGGILHPDSALYLISALKYAGMDYYHIAKAKDLYFSPIISFLTAIVFRLGITDKMAIVIVTMIISFIGYYGLYILFKFRFNPLLSFLGVVIFGCSSIVIFNMPQGLIDIPSVSLSIWALVFAIAAIDKNPKYFPVSFVLLAIGFFVKYTVGFMLPVIFLYYVMRRGFIDNVDCLLSNPGEVKDKFIGYLKSKEFKYIVIGCVLGLILAVVICKTLILDYGGSLTFMTQSVNTFNGHKFYSPTVYLPQKSHYVREFPVTFFQNRVGGFEFCYFLYCIFAAGFIIYLIGINKNKEFIKEDMKSFKTKYFRGLSIILFVLCIVVSAYAFKVLSNHLVSNISLLVGITILYANLQKYNIHEDRVSLDLTMAAYFLVYFIFLSLYDIKVRRYAMPFVPPFIYLILWGMNSISKWIDEGFESFKGNLTKNDNDIKFSRKASAFPVILILLLVVSTAIFIAPQEITRDNVYFTAIYDKGFVNDLRDACDYIKESDPDYHNERFASFAHSQRVIRWYLNVPVGYIPDNPKDMVDYDDNRTYVILNRTQDFDNFHEVFNSGVYTVYKHN